MIQPPIQQPSELAVLYALSATGEPGALELGFDYRCVPGFSVADKLHTDADGTTYTTYDDFGARADGSYDDYNALYNAHVLAAKEGCDVRATTGGADAAKGRTYHLFKPYAGSVVELCGDVDWQGATLVVHDEGIDHRSGRREVLLRVRGADSAAGLATAASGDTGRQLVRGARLVAVPAPIGREADYGRAGILGLAGAGTLRIEDCDVAAEGLVRIGGAQGGWDGTIELVDCTWRPLGGTGGALLFADLGAAGTSRLPDLLVDRLTVDAAAGDYAVIAGEPAAGAGVGILPSRVTLNRARLERDGEAGSGSLRLTAAGLAALAEGDEADAPSYWAADVSVTTEAAATAATGATGDADQAEDADLTCALLAGKTPTLAGAVTLTLRKAVSSANTVAVSRDGEELVAATAVGEQGFARTFEAPGSYVVTVGSTSAADGWVAERTLAFSIAGQTPAWGAPTYTWSTDHLHVTATRSRADGGATETETVAATGELTRAATCEAPGSTTYASAVFKNEAFAAQTVTVAEPAALGHSWQFVAFDWTGDDESGYSSAVAHFTCENDVSHTKVAGAVLTSERVDATYDAPGSVTYAATLAADASADGQAHSDAKVVAIPQLVRTPDPAVVAPLATVTRGGNAVELSENVVGAVGTVSYAVAAPLAGCSLDAVTGRFVSGNVVGTCVVTVTVAPSEAHTGRTAQIEVRVSDKATAALSVAQVGATFGETLAAPVFERPAGTVSTTVVFEGELRRGGDYGPTDVAPSEAGSYAVSVVCETADTVHSGSADFEIAPASIAGAEVVLGPALVYDGTPQTQLVARVLLGGNDVLALCDVGGNVARDAGEHELAVVARDASNYTDTVKRTFFVSPAPLAVRAADATVGYGDPCPTPSVSYVGLMAADGGLVPAPGVVAGALIWSFGGYAPGAQAGETFSVTPGGLSSSNYDISYQPATLTVVPRRLGVAWDAAKLVYDGSAKAPAATLVGVVGEDEVSAAVAGARTAAGGGYVATVTGLVGAKAENYELAGEASTTFAISRRQATVTAIGASKAYGEADPALEARVEGLVEGEDEGLLAYSLAREPGEGVGSYAVTPSGAAEQGNYAVSYVPATLVIGKAPIAPAVSIAGWVAGAYDELASAPRVTGNLGGGALAFAYKPFGASDGTYAEEPPTIAGTYVVRATVAETESYLGGVAVSAPFELAPAPVRDVTSTGENWSGGHVSTGGGGLAGAVPVTSVERLRLNAGEPMSVWMEVRNRLAADVEATELSAALAVLGDRRLGAWLDASVYKRLAEAPEPTRVPELDHAVTVVLELPEGLRPAAGVKRDWWVVRVHDGIATLLLADYEPATGTLSFASSLFSTYAVAYRDTPYVDGDFDKTGGVPAGAHDAVADARKANAGSGAQAGADRASPFPNGASSAPSAQKAMPRTDDPAPDVMALLAVGAVLVGVGLVLGLHHLHDRR